MTGLLGYAMLLWTTTYHKRENGLLNPSPDRIKLTAPGETNIHCVFSLEWLIATPEKGVASSQFFTSKVLEMVQRAAIWWCGYHLELSQLHKQDSSIVAQLSYTGADVPSHFHRPPDAISCHRHAQALDEWGCGTPTCLIKDRKWNGMA